MCRFHVMGDADPLYSLRYNEPSDESTIKNKKKIEKNTISQG